MKKIILTAAAVFAISFANAQEAKSSGGQTSKGKFLIEANTGNAMLGNTGFYLTSSDGQTNYNIGLDGGYFVADNFAVKAGLGYGDNSVVTTLSYRLGAKYYVNSMIPITLDLTGASTKDAIENPLWLGIGGGYAIFLGENVSIEPGLRYNLSLNDKFTDKGILQFNVGFALHF